MLIPIGSTIGNHPAIKVRDYLKANSITDFSANELGNSLGITVKSAVILLAELVERKYIEMVPEPSGSLKNDTLEYPYYRITADSYRFMLARCGHPITREKATRLKDEFMQRVKQVNESDEYLYRVKFVILFGSYLEKDKSLLGDLDLAVYIEGRYDSEKQIEKDLEYVNQWHKTHFSNLDFMSQLMLARNHVLKFLKNKSPYISIHGIDDGVLKLTNKLLIYGQENLGDVGLTYFEKEAITDAEIEPIVTTQNADSAEQSC